MQALGQARAQQRPHPPGRARRADLERDPARVPQPEPDLGMRQRQPLDGLGHVRGLGRLAAQELEPETSVYSSQTQEQHAIAG